MSSKLFDAGLAAMTFSRHVLLEIAADIPKDKLCHQPFPNANHAMWILGHLANADEYFPLELGKRPAAKFEKTKGLFYLGSKPSPKLADYPPIEEIKDYLASAREGLVGWFKSLPESQLATPLPDSWKTFAPTYGALMFSVSWHEGMHTGQLTTIRKSLGLSPKFG